MDFSKLSNGAKLALIGGAVLVVNLFLPWFSWDNGLGGSVSWDAFDSGFLAWFGSLAAIAGAVVLLLKAFGTKEMSAGQFKTEQLAVVLGGVGLLLILIRTLAKPSFLGFDLGASYSFGVFVGLVAAAIVTYGAFMAMKDAGLKMPGMGSAPKA